MRGLAVVVVLLVAPAQLYAQEASQCFEIEFTGLRPTSVADLEEETLHLTNVPYSRDRDGYVVWREAALSGNPRATLVWRGIPGDSIEVLPAERMGNWRLRAARSDGTLSGFLSWISDNVGRADPTYHFLGREVPCTD